MTPNRETFSQLSGVCTSIGAQGAGEPGGRPAGQRDHDVPQHAGQERGLPRVAGGQARDLLGERLPLAGGAGTEEPADGQPDHQPAPADRDIGEPPRVTAVHRADTVPQAGHDAVPGLALASTSSSPAAATTPSTTAPARCGRRTSSSAAPAHDKHTSSCDNDKTDSWKNGRRRQPPDYQESTHVTRKRSITRNPANQPSQGQMPSRNSCPPIAKNSRTKPVLTAPCCLVGMDSPALGLTAMPSGRRPLGEQVAHRTRLMAEEVAEERVNAREASLAGSPEEPEQEPGHDLRGAPRDLLGHPLSRRPPRRAGCCGR